MALLDENNLNRAQFAALLGIGKSTVSAYFNHDLKPHPDVLTAIADEFGVTLDWLMMGRPPKYYTPDGTPAKGRIPIVSIVHAGEPVEAQDGDYGWEYITDESIPKSVDCAIRIEGDSMLPTLHEQDIVYITRSFDQECLANGDLVVIRTEEGTVIRRFRRHNNNLWFIPDNPNYEPIGCPPTSVEVLGLAKGYRRFYEEGHNTSI